VRVSGYSTFNSVQGRTLKSWKLIDNFDFFNYLLIFGKNVLKF
jgi:hypothetical protein